MNSDWTHFLSTLVWGVYGIAVGVYAVSTGYNNDFVWLSIVTAIVGNSAHLVAFAMSKTGLQIAAQKVG